MNSSTSIKINLFNYIKSFSMPDFPNLKIFSKTFFNDLFLKFYKNDNKYTLLYGDIDGLRNLNDRIGFDKANLAIEKLLKTILHYLPENITSFRVGGDEFCFVIPDLSADETRIITKQIHEALESNADVKGLGITFGASDSSEFDNISDMYNFVENKVNLKKHFHLKFGEPVKNVDDYNNKLDALIDSTIKTYINSFRFSSNRCFEPEDLKVLSYPVLDSITKLLGNKNVENSTSNNNVQLESDNDNLKMDYGLASKIYDIMINDKLDDDVLDSISIDGLKAFRNHLSTDSITGAYNNVYRDHFLFPRFQEDKVSFKTILIESLGIKMLNSISSHSSTDLKIKSTFDCLINELNSIIPEDSNIKLCPIHAGGATFEIIVQNDTNNIITPDAVDDILNKVNLDENNIKLFGMVGNCADASEHDEVYSYLNNICEEKKTAIKNDSDYFITPEALKLLDVSLSSVVNFFEVQSKNLGINNEKEKKNFVQKVINSLINNFHELNLFNNSYGKKESSEYSR